MRIKIATTPTADIPEEFREQLNISALPLTITTRAGNTGTALILPPARCMKFWILPKTAGISLRWR